MREEKAYLLQEVENHLEKSEYFFLVDYKTTTVAETSDLRKQLRAQGAEFHVVKNRILKQATNKRSLSKIDSCLKGQNAVIVGGKNPSEVAKIIQKFSKDKDKLNVKGGALSGRVLSASDVDALSKLPSFDVLRAQLLALLNTPATQCVRILQAVPQGLLNVLQARSQQ